MRPLNGLSSLRAKVAVLVTLSVVLSTVLASAMTGVGLMPWLVVPSVVVVSLALTQVLARGMTQPLRDMTAAARAMDGGDFTQRVDSTARDEVGELAAAFNDMAGRLAASERQRQDVVRAVTEDLGSSLPALRALLESLAAGVVRPEPAALATALGQAERLRTLVLALTDLTSLEAGESRLEPEHVALRPFLQDAVRDARQAGYPAQYDIRLEPFDLIVDTDRARLMLLVACLLDNAGRHIADGGTVTVRGYLGDGRFVLEVDDAGGALVAEERLNVLGRHTAGTGPEAGPGLGLALAGWAADLLGGTLEVLEGRTRGNLVRASVPHVPVRRTGWKGAARTPHPDQDTAAGAPVEEPAAAEPAVTAARNEAASEEARAAEALTALLEARLGPGQDGSAAAASTSTS